MRVPDVLLVALDALVANKLRSALTLLGIVAGVASIIAVMTGISVIQGTLEREVSVLGAQTFQVQKWPAGGFGGDAARRKAMKRPPLTLANAQAIRDQVTSADLVGSEIWDFGYVASYKGQSTNPNISICGGTPEYPQNNTHYVGLGRNISPMDVRAARSVVVIGHAIAEKLFPFVDPTEKDIRLDGRTYQVVGVFDEKKSAFGGNFDNYVLIPVSTYVNVYGLVDRNGFPRSVNITVRAKTPAQINDAIEQTRQVLRRVRGLRPKDEDNFEFFNSQSLITQFNQISKGVKLGAFLIGAIALIVAGAHAGDRDSQGGRRAIPEHPPAVSVGSGGAVQYRWRDWGGHRIRDWESGCGVRALQGGGATRVGGNWAGILLGGRDRVWIVAGDARGTTRSH